MVIRVGVHRTNKLDLRLQGLASPLVFRFGDFALCAIESDEDVACSILQCACSVSGILLQLGLEWWGERRCRVCVDEVW